MSGPSSDVTVLRVRDEQGVHFLVMRAQGTSYPFGFPDLRAFPKRAGHRLAVGADRRAGGPDQASPESGSPSWWGGGCAMVRSAATLVLALTAGFVLGGCGEDAPSGASGPDASAFAGSPSCRACHERFYELWASSRHGTALQPYTAAFAAAELTPQAEPIEIDGVRFRADVESGVVREDGPEGERTWSIVQVMGGKNVYYLLTPTERGRLQVLPVAYDVCEKQWYDTTASMIRHAIGHPTTSVHWTDSLLTFNTSCWNCHVSQLSLNYDAETDTYRSEWVEPGINCETCHGPGAEHVRVCEEAPEGEVPEDLRIVLVSAFDETQTNDTCAPCHAKAILITSDFRPGDRYFDHFDLVCLEDLDFHPDGRDLGENYSFTLWRMSPCAISGALDCAHCHTSSGRYRFHGERANEACLPCHRERVDSAPAHTHHPAGSVGNRCISCHMPMTIFARMQRSDHSMRPPAPTLTIAFSSPNACTSCHTTKSAAWADEHVRAWRERDYQAPMLHQATLVAAARSHDWTRLDEILAYIGSGECGEIVATSLIRLLDCCPDERKVPVLLEALRDPSPLVRSAAAAGLSGGPSPEVARALLDATGDDVRLVRIRAAGALAGFPPRSLAPEVAGRLARATSELEAALAARPDSWNSYYNLGNLYGQRGEYERAIACYEKAVRMRADVEAPWVNVSMLYARLGHHGRAERALRRALEIAPSSAAANFNLGLVLAEKGRTKEARECLRRALETDPHLAAAAYNLGGLLVEDDPAEALVLYRKAWELRPDSAKYAFACAWAWKRAGEAGEAVRVLGDALSRGATSADLYGLLGALHEERGDAGAARAIYERAAEDARLAPREREAFGRRLGESR